MTSTDIQLTFAEYDDPPALTEIYNYYALNFAIAFDTEHFSTEARKLWLSQFTLGCLYQ
jgi:L-amino acid N-acyltransferase YncA